MKISTSVSTASLFRVLTILASLACSGRFTWAGAGSLQLDPSVVGEWPGYRRGPANGVTVLGNLAFVAHQTAGLFIVDIADPAHLQIVSRCDLFTEAYDVGLASGHAFVAGGEKGMLVLDVRNIASPQLVARAGTLGSANGICITDNIAYIACGEGGLELFDIAEPVDPRALGRCDTPGYARRVVVSGGRALVADQLGGLQVIDVTNPANPVSVGSYPTRGAALGIAVQGTHAYVADGYWYASVENLHYWGEGLVILDIANPESPTLISTFAPNLTFARDVALAEDVAYVCGDHLVRVDISDPRTPRLTGKTSIGGGGWAVAVSDTAILTAGVVGLVSSRSDPRDLVMLDYASDMAGTDRKSVV